MEWMRRMVIGEQGTKRRAKASMAALVFGAVSCLVQGIDFVRNDIKPVIEILRQNTATMQRIEQRLEDHETRLKKLEGKK